MVNNWRSRNPQRGAAALEFAIVLPVLLLMLVGIVDFGMVMGAQAQVFNAAREGARAGALTGIEKPVTDAVTSGLSGMAGTTKEVKITCTTVDAAACLLTDPNSDKGSMITVTITYEHTWLSPVVLGFSPTITLQGKSQMRIEA